MKLAGSSKFCETLPQILTGMSRSFNLIMSAAVIGSWLDCINLVWELYYWKMDIFGVN